jgi:hypothetical protein
LVTEHKDFGLEPSSRLETSRNRAEQQADTLNHQDWSLAAIRSLSIPDWVFGRDNHQNAAISSRPAVTNKPTAISPTPASAWTTANIGGLADDGIEHNPHQVSIV